MTWPIIDICEQIVRRTRKAKELACDVEVVPLRVLFGTDVVNLTRSTGGEKKGDRLCVILDIQPVAHLVAIAIDRDIGAVDEIGDKEGDQLLEKLSRSVVVGATGDYDVLSVTPMRGERHQVAPGLGGRVRARRRKWRGLVCSPDLDRTVNLVGRDMEKTANVRFACGRQEDLRTDDIRTGKLGCPIEGAVDKGLSGGVNDRVASDHGRGNNHGVTNVASDKGVPRFGFEIGQGIGVCRVSQGIEVDDLV